MSEEGENDFWEETTDLALLIFGRITAKGEKAPYSVDNIILTVGFGFDFDMSNKELYFKNIELVIYNDVGRSVLIRKIESISPNDEYRYRIAESINYNYRSYQKLDYSHIEEIKIPLEIFDRSSGWVGISLSGVYYDNDSNKEREGGVYWGAQYKLDGNNIILSNGMDMI